jgi:hypothetical protein
MHFINILIRQKIGNRKVTAMAPILEQQPTVYPPAALIIQKSITQRL